MENKMKKMIKLVTSLLLISAFWTPVALAAEEVVMIGGQQVQSDQMKGRSLLGVNDQQEPFEAKTEKEREQLPQSEQELINKIEDYLVENANPEARNFGVVANKLISALVFDVAIRRDNLIINAAELFGIMGTSEQSTWFNAVSGKSDRYLTVFDEPTGADVKLHAFYVDNQSDKTAVVQHGYRSNAMNIMREAELLYNLGYNVIIPDARSHGRSEGAYIAFGAYEKNDINGWIDQELATKPDQKIVLLGVSMGAATVMMSQETPHPNVQALIEDCGYYSIEQQARDVTRLITSKLQYIPLVNSIDWNNCEDQILGSLNDNYVKPILKVDLFSISPLNAVSQSNVPKLFIHGTADWFIPPVAMTKLYDASLGYKEQLSVVGAGHAVNISVGGELYSNKVTSFLNTVEQMTSLRPELAATTNLLVNPEFKRNQAETSFDAWRLSNNGTKFTENWQSNPYEFIMKRSGNEIVSAISVDTNGLKFYKKWDKSAGYVGQDVALVKDETYELSFDAWNPNPTEYSEQVISYGFGKTTKTEKQKVKNKVQKKLSYSPTTSGIELVSLGSEMTYFHFLGQTNTTMYLSDVKLVNTDVTAPNKVGITSVNINGGGTTIKGQAEANSNVLVKTVEGESVIEVTADPSGNFVVTIPQQVAGTVLHLINQDTKGNTSESVVLVSN